MKVTEIFEATVVVPTPVKLPKDTPWVGEGKRDLGWYEGNSNRALTVRFKSAIGPTGGYKVRGFTKVSDKVGEVTIKREGEDQTARVEFDAYEKNSLKFFCGGQPYMPRQAFNQFHYNAAKKAGAGKK